MKPLMDALKESTRERHARMEGLPFIAALTSGELPLNCYVAQLRALAVIHATLDHELRQAQPTEIITLYQARPSRLALLRSDLSVFDRLPDCLASIERALHIADWIRKVRLEHPEDLPGLLYVLEGTTLGNAVHLRDVVKAFGERVAGAVRYYAGYGDKTGEYWKEFGAAMNALPVDGTGRERLITAGHAFFDCLERLYSALYPVAEDGWGFTASMLNPEAGNHQVPNSETEIRAAIIAARRCREEFPYFDERYRERGESFAKSDAAWLVTLTALPRSQLLSQVEWLGRVLSNRGMPRLTLERQLELLYEELASAFPERSEVYGGLLEASSFLRSERLQAISEAVFHDLARQFHIASNDELGGRLSRTGELIASAVCDEAQGISNAVDSLVSWITDGQRFPAAWIEAVKSITELARIEVARSGRGRNS